MFNLAPFALQAPCWPVTIVWGCSLHSEQSHDPTTSTIFGCCQIVSLYSNLITTVLLSWMTSVASSLLSNRTSNFSCYMMPLALWVHLIVHYHICHWKHCVQLLVHRPSPQHGAYTWHHQIWHKLWCHTLKCAKRLSWSKEVIMT